MMRWLLLLLPFLLFAQKPDLWLLESYDDQNLSGWVMSEKLDGIRAYWDGKQLMSRGGKVIHAPEWFVKEYPPFAIDGELWSQRGDFETIASIVRDKTPGSDWKKISHYIFEVPDANGSLLQRLAKVKPYENDVLKIIPQIPIENKKHLETFLKKIEHQGGEGVVVRDPKQPYIAARTNTALKVKSFQDSECTVTGYSEGKGKYTGLVGAFTCKMDAVTFSIGSGLSDALRHTPVAVGTVITFKHQGFTKYAKPRFPVYLRVRDDQ